MVGGHGDGGQGVGGGKEGGKREWRGVSSSPGPFITYRYSYTMFLLYLFSGKITVCCFKKKEVFLLKMHKLFC